MQQNKNKGKDAKKADGSFSSKNVKHNPQDESSRAKTAPGSSSDGQRHTNSK